MIKNSLGRVGLGEIRCAELSYALRSNISHNTPTDICSIELPFGKWALVGGVFACTGNATFSEGTGWVSSISATSDSKTWVGIASVIPTGLVVTGATGGASWSIFPGKTPITIDTASKTFYLSANPRYSSGGPAAFYGYMTFMCVG